VHHLERGLIVVLNRQGGVCGDQEFPIEAGVAHIVDHSSDQQRGDCDLIQLQCLEDIACGQQVEGGLGHICGMEGVVVRLRIVRIVNDSKEGAQLGSVQLKRINERVLLESVEADGLKRTGSDFLEGKDIEMPIAGLLEDLNDLARQPLELYKDETMQKK
jgi:hypothetical protein